MYEQHGKPGSVVNGHLSWPHVTMWLQFRFCGYYATYPKARRATVSLYVRSCFGWGLHSLSCYQKSGGLLSHLSILTCVMLEKQTWIQAVYFCCTSLGVASTGRYPALCPVKPGLSSPIRARPSVLLTVSILPWYKDYVNMFICLCMI